MYPRGRLGPNLRLAQAQDRMVPDVHVVLVEPGVARIALPIRLPWKTIRRIPVDQIPLANLPLALRMVGAVTATVAERRTKICPHWVTSNKQPR